MLETLWIFIIEIIALFLSSCAICIIFLLLTTDFLLLLDDLRKYITAVGIIFYLILDNFKGNFFNLDWSMGSGWENSSVIITFGGLVFVSSMLLVEVCQIIWSLCYTCPVLIFGYFIKHSAPVALCTFSLSIYVFVQLGSSYNHCQGLYYLFWSHTFLWVGSTFLLSTYGKLKSHILSSYFYLPVVVCAR